jgi:roadblock/LC7 domain-containing protein
MKTGRYLFAVVCLSFAAIAAVIAQEQRPLTPDDLFKIEGIGEAAFSPDGKVLAYVKRRSTLAAREYQQVNLLGTDRADIWLAPLSPE